MQIARVTSFIKCPIKWTPNVLHFSCQYKLHFLQQCFADFWLHEPETMKTTGSCQDVGKLYFAKKEHKIKTSPKQNQTDKIKQKLPIYQSLYN